MKRKLKFFLLFVLSAGITYFVYTKYSTMTEPLNAIAIGLSVAFSGYFLYETLMGGN